MNKTLLSGLLGIFILCSFNLPAQNTCFSAWRYVVDIPFFNPNGLSQTDFQLKIILDTQTLIQAGKMNADGSDLRFTGSDCCASLPYWIRSGINTASTEIWVKTPFIPSFGTPFALTMYYGNPTATTTLSNIDSVMLSVGSDSTGSVAAPRDSVFSSQAITIPIDGRTVVWRVYSHNGGNIQLKMFNDTNKVNGSSAIFSLPPGPGYSSLNYESVSVPGSHVGFHTLDSVMAMTSCTPVSPCPGSCGDLAYEPGNLFPPQGVVRQQLCGLVPNLKVWYRKFLFIDPLAQIGTELDRSIAFNAAASGATSFCIGDSVQLVAVGVGAPNYQWYNDGTPVPGATDTAYVALDSGYYYCVAFWGDCQTLTSDTIHVTAITPFVDLGLDRVVCTDTGETLDAGSGFASYLWSDNSTGTSLLATTTDTYWVLVTDSNNCTSGDTVDLVIQALPNPVINPAGTVSLCPGESATLEAYNPNWYAYLWNFNGETSSDLVVDSSGSFFVTVYDSLFCSNSSEPVTVVLNPPAVVNLGQDTSICRNETLVVSVDPSWANVLWSDNSTGPSISVNQPGGYSVQVVDVNGCGAVDTIVVSVTPIPTTDIGGDLIVCPGATAALNGGAGFAAYAWSSGESQQNIVVGAGTYQVVVTDSNGCQNGSNIVTVSEYPGIPTPVVSGDQAGISSTEEPNYQWYYEGVPIAGANSQTHIPAEPGIYSVSADDPDGCGTKFSEDFLVVFGLTKDDIPEGFSPNGDGINDNWEIRYIELFPQNTVSIRNRWGATVYETSPYTNSFNGTSDQGARLPDGTYFYILDPGNGDEKLSGYIIINR